MILICQISLNLVSGIPINSKLMIDLLQSPLHFVLTRLDVIHLPHQTVLHTIIDKIYSLSPLSKYQHLDTQNEEHV